MGGFASVISSTMFRVVLLLLFVSLIVCQSGGNNGICSAQEVPGPYSPAVSVYGDTTSDVSSTAPSCGSSSSSGILWFSINTDVGANVTVSTCSSYTDFDTYIRVYSGNCNIPSCVAYGDDEPCQYSSTFSTVNWISTGDAYIIGVGGYSTAQGKFELIISAEAGRPEGCSNADLIPGPYSTPVSVYDSTVGLSAYSTSYCLLSTVSPVKWYEIMPNAGDQVTVSTCNPSTDFDTTLSVFTGDCNNLVCAFSSDDNCTSTSNGRASVISFPASQTSYYVAVSGYNGASGNYELSVTANTPTGCENAIPVRIGESVFGSTVGAPSLSSALPYCSITAIGPGSWYYLPSGTQSVTATTCSASTNFDTILVIYQGSCPGSLTCVNSNDDSSCNYYSTQSSVSFNLSPTYNTYIIVGGYEGQSGSYRLTINSN